MLLKADGKKINSKGGNSHNKECNSEIPKEVRINIV
jgi:hypothetical protein